jgi:hypothetical protein
MKGMGLATRLALLYYHIIIVELWNNKDSRCYLLYLDIIIMHVSSPCIVCLFIPRISSYLHVFSLAFVFYLEVAENYEFSNFVELCGSIPGLRGTWGVTHGVWLSWHMRHTCVLWYVDDGDWCVRAVATQTYTNVSPRIKLSSTYARKKLRPLSINHLRSRGSVFYRAKKNAWSSFAPAFIPLYPFKRSLFPHNVLFNVCLYNVSGEDTGTSTGHYTPLRDHYFCWHGSGRTCGRRGSRPTCCVGDALPELIFAVYSLL